MKINIQINKMMIKMNKQRYFDGSFGYSRASWGVLGCLVVSWGNKTDPDIAISERLRLAPPLVHHNHHGRFESWLIFELITLFKFALRGTSGKF